MIRASQVGDFSSDHGGQITGGISVGGGAAVAAGLAAHAAWVPVVGIALAAVTFALGLWFSRKGPQQKIATTEIVDKLENDPTFGLKANLAAYLAGPRTATSQAQALANFDASMAYLQSAQGCANPQYGDPGHNCISDRSPGGKWDWFAMYRQPIANDPQAQMSSTIADILPGLSPQTTAALSTYALPAALILIGVFA